MKFDGVDINAGCPQKNVTSHGGGACLIKDPTLMKEIIDATRQGAGDLPVSVKTRLGYKKISDDWIQFLLEQNLDALIIHGRTVSELSKVPAHWDEIGKAVVLKNHMKKDTVIIGNGDVVDYADAVQKCKTYGTDGAMIGRGIFHNLWAFDTNGITHMDDHKELLRIMRKHMQLFEKTGLNFSILKKFFKMYVQGFPHASEIRERLMETENSKEAEKILDTIV
jgi:tRNA-dihydrouridine synthase